MRLVLTLLAAVAVNGDSTSWLSGGGWSCIDSSSPITDWCGGISTATASEATACENHDTFNGCNGGTNCVWTPATLIATDNASCVEAGGKWVPNLDHTDNAGNYEAILALNNEIHALAAKAEAMEAAAAAGGDGAAAGRLAGCEKEDKEPNFEANHVLIGIAAGLFVFTLVAAFLIDMMGWFKKPDGGDDGLAEPDEMAVDIDDGPICGFCPSCYTLSVAVISCGLLGFVLGALINIAFTECTHNMNSEETMKMFDMENEDFPEGVWTGVNGDLLDETGAQTPGSPRWCSDSRRDYEKLISIAGTLWVSALKLFVGPLMVFMFLIMPFRVSNYARKGWRTLFLLTCTSFFAAMEGLLWVNLIQPGKGMNLMTRAMQAEADAECGDNAIEIVASEWKKDPNELKGKITVFNSFTGILEKAVVKDIIGAISGLNIFAVILFFCCLGVCLKRLNKNESERRWRDATANCSRGVLAALLRMVVVVIFVTPLGMLSLVTYQIARMNNEKYLQVLSGVAMYVLTQFIGQFVHMFVFYPIFSFLATCHRKNKDGEGACSGYGFFGGWVYFGRVWQAPMTAFATSSSAATLPVTLAMVKNQDRGNIPKASADLCVPLGAAINMDGTGLGFPVMIVFTAQAFGYEMPFGEQFVVALIAVVCSIGTAPIPNAGLVYITMLFSATNNEFLSQDEVIGTGLTLILLMDWLVDRFETAQNVWSDCNIARIISIWEEENPACCSVPCACIPGCSNDEKMFMLEDDPEAPVAKDLPEDSTGAADAAGI